MIFGSNMYHVRTEVVDARRQPNGSSESQDYDIELNAPLDPLDTLLKDLYLDAARRRMEKGDLSNCNCWQTTCGFTAIFR